MSVLPEITRVFDLEIEALLRVRAAIDHRYVDAVRLLFECGGKVVVTGWGSRG